MTQTSEFKNINFFKTLSEWLVRNPIMAYLTGLKKQINKANQYMSEKVSGVEGTKLDDDFYIMEKKSDLVVELVDDLQIKTKEYLQPNPTVRAKMAAVKVYNMLPKY